MKIRRPSIRHLFLCAGILGLLLNLVYDFIAFHENKAADQSGIEVIHQYEVASSLERLDHAVEVLVLPPLTEGKFERVRLALGNALHLATDPHEVEALEVLEKNILAHRVSPDMTKIVREMNFEETVRTQKKVEQDWLQNARVNHSLSRALAFDLLLVALLLFCFYFELRQQRKIEGNFMVSLDTLRESNSTLQEELARRQVALKTTVHDLKNPLSSIHGFAELISDQGADAQASVREFSEVIRRISENSLQMINSLLFKNDEHPLPMATVDLRKILADLCTQMDVLTRAKGQTLMRELGPQRLPVRGHKTKLEELFSNLLSNAIKYSPQGSTIHVRIFDLGASYRIEIVDRGPGFSAEDKAAAFGYGRTLSASPTGGERASGFGLFIAKQIAELHQARIDIRDGAAGGTVVSVELSRYSYRIVRGESGQFVEDRILDI